MHVIWKRGLDLLAEAKCKAPEPDGPVDFVEVGELMDKLLVGTSECQDPQEISDYLVSQHGWSAPQAEQVAMLYDVVDAVRTNDRPIDFHWAADLVEQLLRDQ